MKIVTLILMTIFLGKGCSSQSQNDMKTAIVEYNASSRGFYQNIIIQNQMISVSKNRNGDDKLVPVKISDSDWKELIGYFEKIQLDSLPSYKGPTEKRFYDGAAIANLKITFKEKEYNSASFDHGTPPLEIEKLVNKMVTLGK
jgi:hypothetical protein